MLHISKPYEEVPQVLRKASAKLQTREAYLQTQSYRHVSVRAKLRALYHNKCGFCESKPSMSSRVQVEHFRPRARLQESDEHTGYYWLALEWSNLLYACSRCNDQGAKGNYFPILGKRVGHPPPHIADQHALSKEMLAEEALLLHPEIDYPQDHIWVDPDGMMHPIHNSLKGEMSIRIYQLNREDLIIEGRKKLLDRFFKRIKRQLFWLIQAKRNGEIRRLKEGFRLAFYDIFEEMQKACEADQAYSYTATCACQNFSLFLQQHQLTKHLSPKLQSVIEAAYEGFVGES